MIICALKQVYMHTRGGAAHAAMETNAWWPTTYRLIPLCREVLARRYYYYWLLPYM